MEKRYSLIIVLVVTALFITGCTPREIGSICEGLSKEMNDKIEDSNDPSIISPIGGFEGVIGGTLLSISETWFYVPSDEEQEMVTYTLTFKGMSETGTLSLRTSSEPPLPYKTGEFYKLDLKNKNQYSMQLSGVFMDPDQNALQKVDC